MKKEDFVIQDSYYAFIAGNSPEWDDDGKFSGFSESWFLIQASGGMTVFGELLDTDIDLELGDIVLMVKYGTSSMNWGIIEKVTPHPNATAKERFACAIEALRAVGTKSNEAQADLRDELKKLR